MAQGIDRPHDYRASIEIQIPSQHSSSTGPAPAGPMHNEPQNNNVPDASAFADAHGQARSGDLMKPTTAGKLASGVYGGESAQSYNPGEATTVTRVKDGARCFEWPDAPGGGLGRSNG